MIEATLVFVLIIAQDDPDIVSRSNEDVVINSLLFHKGTTQLIADFPSTLYILLHTYFTQIHML